MSNKLTSKIELKVELDENRVPESLSWSAEDGGIHDEEAKAMMLSVWDNKSKETLRIDLWTKDMPVDEMKKFYIDCVGGIAQSALTSTGDEYISNELKEVCERLVQHVQKELSGQ